MKSRPRSFADLAEALGFGSRSSLKPELDALRSHSSVSLVRKSSYTRHKYVPHHLPTHLIIHILSFCQPATLLSCLRVSRLFFNLAGTILYSSLVLSTTADMWGVFKGDTLLYENTTGKVAVGQGRRRFKDRLLRHTIEVTLHSHGDEDDNPNTNTGQEEDYFSFKRFSVLSFGSSSSRTNSRSSTPLTSPAPAPNCFPGDCPPVPLNGIMPRLSTLRVVLADAFDYHLLFCPRMSTCPLLEGLEIDKLVILGARSPLVVLPTAFPSTHRSYPSTPNPSTLALNHTYTRALTPPASAAFASGSTVATVPGLGKASAPSTANGNVHKSTGGLPVGLRELVIVLPTGRSYDAKDYEDQHHIFHHRHSADALARLSIVFLSPKDRPWQVAFYDSRSDNAWTSYLCLAEDIAHAALSVAPDTRVEVVGIEKLDGELLNMGVGVMREGRAGVIMEDRVRRRMEVRLKAKARDGEVAERMGNTCFRPLTEWLVDNAHDLGEEMEGYHHG